MLFTFGAKMFIADLEWRAEGRTFEDATPDVSSMIMNSMQMKLDDVHAAYESAWQNCW